MEKTRWSKNGTQKVEVPSLKPQEKSFAEQNTEMKKILEKGKDDRIRMIKGKEHLALPNLNQLYDTLKTPNAWRYVVDATISGTYTTVANSDVVVPVKFSQNTLINLSKWPGAVQLYPVINFFSTSPQTPITTVGSVKIVYNDNSGINAGLGCFVSNSSYTTSNDFLIPGAIVDIGELSTSTGNLLITLTGTTPTTATYDYVMNMSLCYLLPAQKGYTIHEYDQWLEEFRYEVK